MKTFIVLLGILLICISCDQFNKQPEKLSKEKKFELSERCAKAGKAYFDDFSRSTNTDAFRYKNNYLWDDPEYHYSEKLNTCLVHIQERRIRWWWGGSLSMERLLGWRGPSRREHEAGDP